MEYIHFLARMEPKARVKYLQLQQERDELRADIYLLQTENLRLRQRRKITESMIERAAMAMAGVTKWPTNEELGGDPFTGTRDDEFRDEYIDMARVALRAAFKGRR